MRSEAKAEVTTSKPGAASVFFFLPLGMGGGLQSFSEITIP